jgi:lysyl endopeptidase
MKRVLAALFLAGTPLFAQYPVEPTAASQPAAPLEAVDYVEVPAPDLARLESEDALAEELDLPPRFAVPNEVSLRPAERGTRERLPDGRLLWRLRVLAQGALSINLGFSRYHMSPGGRLIVHSSDGRQVVRPFTATDNEGHGELWTPVVMTEDLVVELTVPESEWGLVELELASINYGYRGFRDKSGACNMDVECLPPGDPWRDQVRAVGVISTGGSTFCSGSLLNDVAQDRKMLFMTANHCGINSGNAASLVVYWNYQNSTCRTPGSPASGGIGDGQLNQFNTGSFFRAARSQSDFTLVELDDPANPSFNLYWAGWDRTTGGYPCSTGSYCAGIHHPNTDEKRITFSQQAIVVSSYNSGTPPPPQPGDGTHLWVHWSPSPPFFPSPPGVTEPGSSGSPLYNADHRFVGQLHGGPSACGATGDNLSDMYGRFAVSWDAGGTPATQARDWLDPLGISGTTLDGVSQCSLNAAPSDLLATPNGPNRVDLTWSSVPGATSYVVYRALGPCPGSGYQVIASGIPGGQPSYLYSDLTVSGGSTYSYRVAGYVNAEGCAGPQSNCAQASATGTCTLPPTFAGLASAASSGTTSCGIGLSWSAATQNCGSGVVYNVHRSTVSNFVPGPANRLASCLTPTSYQDVGVNSGTAYYYVVRAEDNSGNGSGGCANGNEDANLIRRSAVPAGPDANVFFDNMEGGQANWTVAGSGGGANFALVTTDSHSPVTSWFVSDPNTVSDRTLAMTSPVAVPALAGPTLEFWHRVGAETGWDGGVLEYSTDGTSWFDILAGNGGAIPANPARFTVGGYPRALNTSDNPLGGRQAWTGTIGGQGSFLRVAVDLADFSGLSVRFRWRFGSDASVSATGWWVDDVRVFAGTTCVSDLIFEDGFEN